MNKQVKTGKQNLPPMNPKTDTNQNKKDQTFSNTEKGKGQDNQEEIQRQKRSADEDFEEKTVKGTKQPGTGQTDLPGKQQQEKRTTTQQDREDDEQEFEDETEEFDETDETEDEDRNQTDPQI